MMKVGVGAVVTRGSGRNVELLLVVNKGKQLVASDEQQTKTAQKK
jgi:hypothetical protein